MQDVSKTSAAAPRRQLSIEDIRRKYAGAFRPVAWIYWADLALSAVVGWGLFALAVQAPMGSLLQVGAVVGSTFALLRGALFIHELTHIRAGSLPGFEVAWHALIGVPLQIPSLMYVGSHSDHHKRVIFGTLGDPEYAPIATWSRRRILGFVIAVAFVPALLTLRWGVVGPVSRLFPNSRLRGKTIEEWSTLVINTEYRRPHPSEREDRRWIAQESACAVFVWAVAAGLVAGVIPLAFLAVWLVVGAGILIVNQVRTLAAHGYENEGEPVDAEGQLRDSITLRGWPWITGLVAPVGLRFHALHHFLPAVPYHYLGHLHRKLLVELPDGAAYRSTERNGVFATLRDLWRKSTQRPRISADGAPTEA